MQASDQQYSQVAYYTNNPMSHGSAEAYYLPQNHQNVHYLSSDDLSQKKDAQPQVFTAQYCTLESSFASGCYPAPSSSSSIGLTPTSGSPLSQQDTGYSNTSYGSPLSVSCITEDPNDLKVKLKELEAAMLGPEADIADSYESAYNCYSSTETENWQQLMAFDRGDLRQVLIACGKAVAENDTFMTDWLLSELKQLVSVSGEPLQRLGAYMLEGLVAKLSSSGPLIYKSLKCKEMTNHFLQKQPTGSELLSYMQLLYEVCPYYKFGYLSANGAIAEAVKGESYVHIIDFQIAQGSQWITLIQALAARPGGPPYLRITGIDDDNSSYARGGGLHIVGERLARISRSVGMALEFHAVPAASHEVYAEHLAVRAGETIVVNFAYQLHHVADEGVSTENHRDRIIRMVKSLNPKVVTLVEQESNTNTTPFFPRYMETLEHYTAMFESIDVTLPRDHKERINVEQHCVARDIVNLIACEGADRVERHELFGKWKARFVMAGFKPYPLSTVVNGTIKKLLESYCNHYRLEERDGVLYLGWKNRALVVSSAWR